MLETWGKTSWGSCGKHALSACSSVRDYIIATANKYIALYSHDIRNSNNNNRNNECTNMCLRRQRALAEQSNCSCKGKSTAAAAAEKLKLKLSKSEKKATSLLRYS